MFVCQQKQKKLSCFVTNYHPSAIKLLISASGQRQSRSEWIESWKMLGKRFREFPKYARTDYELLLSRIELIYLLSLFYNYFVAKWRSYFTTDNYF